MDKKSIIYKVGKIMKKSFLAIVVVLTVMLSGIAGFVGAYLGNNINDTAPEIVQPKPLTKNDPDASPEWDYEQLNAYLDEFITSKLPVDDTENSDASTDTMAFRPPSQQMTVQEIAALNSDAIVEIYTESVVNNGRMGQFVNEGAGSGVIMSEDGYVITNNHVIEGSSRIKVRLNDGTDYDAVLIGRDSKTDLAVLKIDAKGLHAVTFGDSDKLSVGELAVAIGNPLGKLGGSVTDGVISALSRNIEIDGYSMTLLQTSAAVNPGNSGGGLFNSFGELVGIVNAKSSGTGIEGIGFAIPINLARAVVESLIEHGYVQGRIDFGATLIDILDSWTAAMYRIQTLGVYVLQSEENSSLQVGDRIISINGIEINSASDVDELLTLHEVGDTIKITLSRNGSTITVSHTLKQAM